MSKKEVDAMVDGGKASTGPPLGPSLGVLGVNAGKVVAEINEKTKDYSGMKIPVKIIVDEETKEFEVKIGSPPTSALIKKELGLEKGTKDGSPVGNLTFQQLLRIVKAKKDSLLAKDLKAALKEIIGVCWGLGVTIEGRKAKEITREINEGIFDDVIAGKTDKIPERRYIEVEKKEKIIVEEAPVKEEKKPVEETPEEKKEETTPKEDRLDKKKSK